MLHSQVPSFGDELNLGGNIDPNTLAAVKQEQGGGNQAPGMVSVNFICIAYKASREISKAHIIEYVEMGCCMGDCYASGHEISTGTSISGKAVFEICYFTIKRVG